MFRFGSLALASVAALGCTMATPNVSRAEFDLKVGFRRAHFGIGIGPRVIVAPAPVMVPAPVPVIEPVYGVPLPTPPVVVAPAPPVVVTPVYRPWFHGHVDYRHHEHFHHHQ
jgi:hypothetical protein